MTFHCWLINIERRRDAFSHKISNLRKFCTWNIGSSSVQNCLSIVIVVERQGTLLLEIGYEQTCTKKDIPVKLCLLGWIYKEYIQRIKVAFRRGVTHFKNVRWLYFGLSSNLCFEKKLKNLHQRFDILVVVLLKFPLSR